jgi:hypothetical protein
MIGYVLAAVLLAVALVLSGLALRRGTKRE